MARVRRDEGLPWDDSLLQGFRFACREGCGLCCYATPAASKTEVAHLLSIAPEIACLPGHGEYSLVAARPEGGACQFLHATQCRVHAARPFPCREFPLTVHIGRRVQVSLILSCPGIDLSALERSGTSGLEVPGGLESEIAAVQEEVRTQPVARWLAEGERRWRSAERRLRRDGRMASAPSVALEELVRSPWDTLEAVFPAAPPPSRDTPIENLPLFHDDRWGQVALREHPGGWEAIQVREDGGSSGSLGVFAVPSQLPELSIAARARTTAYLRYVLRRDHFLAGLLLELGGDASSGTTLEEEAAAEVAEICAQVIARAWLRSRLTERPDAPLEAPDIDAGIRAFDAELLDRPTLGRVL